MRILFAEDERDLNSAVKTLLTRSGYQVDAVFDGEDALSCAQTGTYDGIILDWMMPRRDGVETLQCTGGNDKYADSGDYECRTGNCQNHRGGV